MKPVSDLWGKSVYAPIRNTSAEINFYFFDTEAKKNATLVQFPPQQSISNAFEILGENRLIGKIAQLQLNYWKLDGTFILPATEKSENDAYGYWGNSISDENGELPWVGYPDEVKFKIDFSVVVNIPALTIVFDNKTNNYLKDFIIQTFDENGNYVDAFLINDNKEANFVLNKNFKPFRSLLIIGLNTSEPFRNIRISRIDFGLSFNFTDNNIIKSELISEASYLSNALPINQLSFTVFNNGEFDYTSSTGYANYFRKKQQAEYWNSLELTDGTTEKLYMGTYFLESWETSRTQLTIKANLGYTELEEHDYRYYSLMDKKNVGEFIESIFSDADFFNYYIAPELYDTPLIPMYTGNVTNAEALRMVSELSSSIIYKMPGGQIQIKKITSHSLENPVTTIDYENTFKNVATSNEYYNAINMIVTTATAKETPSGNNIAFYTGIGNGEIQNIIIPFDYVLFDNSPTISSTGVTIIKTHIYSNYAEFEILASGKYTITIKGKTVDFNTYSEPTILAPWYQLGEQITSYDFNLPMLLGGEDNKQMRDWCVSERFKVLSFSMGTQSEWRQNSALDIGDTIMVQLDKDGTTVPVVSTKHTYTYNGGLRGSTIGIGKGG